MREQNTSLEKAGLPRVAPGQDPATGKPDFVFNDPLTGAEARFPTEEAAMEHWEQYAQQANEADLDLIHEASLTDTPAFLTSSGKASETTRLDKEPMTGMEEMTVEKALQHRIITPEQLASRVQAYALEQGIPLEQAQQDIGQLVIRARRFSEKMQDGQFRHTVQLFKGANVMDVFEEFSEDSFSRALDEGFADGNDLVADIRRFEDATGQQILDSGYRYDAANRMPLLDALSSLSRAHVIGSTRSGSRRHHLEEPSSLIPIGRRQDPGQVPRFRLCRARALRPGHRPRHGCQDGDLSILENTLSVEIRRDTC